VIEEVEVEASERVRRSGSGGRDVEDVVATEVEQPRRRKINRVEVRRWTLRLRKMVERLPGVGH
jgi:hypothetical protein